ncbi:MAG TPA: TylF/MycF/NovP-related O-methyltransferase [Dissulfurispiraceae bacterium]|nr:TylF/MycF/NovP-related O-methyltransferase [Dissulfurispiraceae bacterium]
MPAVRFENVVNLIGAFGHELRRLGVRPTTWNGTPMRIVKNAIKKALEARGYELRRSISNGSASPDVRFENAVYLLESLSQELGHSMSRGSTPPKVSFDDFVKLVTEYERCLNDSDDLIVPNEVRPRLLARLLGTPPSEAYFIVQALSKCRDIPGDVCEFGVAQGETSALIANEMAPYHSKRLHLFDSFEGLPKPSEKDRLKDDMFSLGSIEAYAGTMAFPEDMVRSRLNAVSFPASRYVIHKGFIEQLIHEDKDLPGEVCFAYVDFDFYEPIKVALEFLHRVTSRGAIMIVDDYDFFSTGAKTAVDEFVEEKRSIYECLIPDPCHGYFAVLSRKA